jgi:hypothetical protein
MATPHAMPGYKGPAIPEWVSIIKPLVILALLAGGGFWLFKKVQQPNAEEPAKAASDPALDQDRAKARRVVARKKRDRPSPVKATVKPAQPIPPPPTPVTTTVSAEPAEPSTGAAPAVPELQESDLTKGLEQAAAFIMESRFAAARSLLRKLDGGHSGKEWWARHVKNWIALDQEHRRDVKELEEEAKEARRALEKADRETIERIMESWRKYAALDDEVTGALGRQILHEAASVRTKVIGEARIVRLAQVEKQLAEYEQLAKSGFSKGKQEEVLKFLATLDEEILDTPAWEAHLVPRVIGLRFDVRRARDGDLMIYRAITRTKGGAAELLYDFATPDQFSAWSYNAPNGNDRTIRAFWDAEAKNVVLHSDGDHDWQKRERKGMPFLAFQADFQSWTAEAEVELKIIGSADVGLLVYEGGVNVLFFGVREGMDKKGNREWVFNADGCLPKEEDFQKELARIPAPAKSNVKLGLSCGGGNVAFRASVGTRALPFLQRVGLAFKPNFLGLYVRTRGTGASAVFDNVKITGTPDANALRARADLARQVSVNMAKEEWLKQVQETRVSRDQAAGVVPKDWTADWKCETAGPCTTFPDRRNARVTRPTDPVVLPCWRRRVKLEPYKNHFLHADLGAPQGVDWVVSVRVNGKEIAQRLVTGPEWQVLDVDLAAYGGEEILLELTHHPGGKRDGDTAYWDRVYVGSR